MTTRKQEIRAIVLDIIFEKEKVEYSPTQFAHLKAGVAELFERRSGSKKSHGYSGQRLSDADTMILMEVFWDLIVEKIITIGLNASNTDFPWFRLHSEAEVNLKKKA